MLAALAGRIYDHAPQQNALPLGGPTFPCQINSRKAFFVSNLAWGPQPIQMRGPYHGCSRSERPTRSLAQKICYLANTLTFVGTPSRCLG